MEVSLDSVNKELPASLRSIAKTFTLAWSSNLVNNTINILSLEQISDLTRRQKIVEVDEEFLLGNLTLSEQEAKAFVLSARLHVECLKIGLQVIHVVRRGDHDTHRCVLTRE